LKSIITRMESSGNQKNHRRKRIDGNPRWEKDKKSEGYGTWELIPMASGSLKVNRSRRDVARDKGVRRFRIRKGPRLPTGP